MDAIVPIAPIGLEIAIPSRQRAAFERQPQALVFFAQRLLGAFNIRDIETGTDVAEKIAIVGEARHAERIHPAVFAVTAAHTEVGFERNALGTAPA